MVRKLKGIEYSMEEFKLIYGRFEGIFDYKFLSRPGFYINFNPFFMLFKFFEVSLKFTWIVLVKVCTNFFQNLRVFWCRRSTSEFNKKLSIKNSWKPNIKNPKTDFLDNIFIFGLL